MEQPACQSTSETGNCDEDGLRSSPDDAFVQHRIGQLENGVLARDRLAEMRRAFSRLSDVDRVPSTRRVSEPPQFQEHDVARMILERDYRPTTFAAMPRRVSMPSFPNGPLEFSTPARSVSPPPTPILNPRELRLPPPAVPQNPRFARVKDRINTSPLSADL